MKQTDDGIIISDKEVQALVDAATNACASTGGAGKGALHKALEPFRPKRPLVSNDWWDSNGKRHCSTKAVQLTPEVITRLGPTGGVDRHEIKCVVIRCIKQTHLGMEEETDAIMQLIEDAGVEVE